jgi:hypothetical protein
MRLLSMMGRQMPPMDEPVTAMPMARARRRRKYCERTDTAGRKMMPMPIPAPRPCASIVCQYVLHREIMKKLSESARVTRR